MKRTSGNKRILAMLLALVMCLGLLPVSALAAQPEVSSDKEETINAYKPGGARVADDEIAVEVPGAVPGSETPAKPLDAETDVSAGVFNVVDYGADPTGKKESSTAVIAALADAAKADPALQKTIYFPEGEYHFYAGYSEVRRLYASNTLSWNEAYNLGYQDKYIGILVENMENVTIDGGGSKLIFHGNICSMAAINSKNVTFTNFEQDHASPSLVEMFVESVDTADNSAVVYVAPGYGYKINGTSITWVPEGNSPEDTTPYWQLGGPNSESTPTTRFSVLSGAPSGGKDPWSNVKSIEQLEDTRLKITYTAGNLPTVGVRYQRRNTAPRMTPGVFVSECDNVTFKDATYRFLHCFGILLQVSKDITFNGVTIGGATDTGRSSGGFADFIHGSTVAGTMTIKNCTFDNAQDDAINIHGTYLQVTGISEDRKTVEVRYMHAEAWGFPQYHVGDKVDFTSQNGMVAVEDSERTVVALCNPGEGTYMDGTARSTEKEEDMRTIIVTLDAPIPEEITVDPKNELGYVMENVTYTPKVVVDNNRFANINACGILVTTRQPIEITNNIFDRTSNASIYIAGAAHGYNESGRVEDLLIQGNTFITNPGTGFKAQGTVRVQPEDGRGVVANPPTTIYKNVRIIDNNFLLFNNRYAINIDNVDGVTVENNRFFRYNPAVKLNLSVGGDGTVAVGGTTATSLQKSAASLSAKLYKFETCENVTIQNNTYDNGLNLGVEFSRGTTADDVTVNGDDLKLGGDNNLPSVGAVSYISSDPAVATVDTNGVVTGVSAGTAEIRAYTMTGGRTFQSSPVTVTVLGSSGAANSISITGPDTVDLNTAATYTATTVPTDAEVTWSVASVSNGAEAGITQAGVLTGTASGVVEVTATAGGVSASKFVTVSKSLLDSKWEVVDELEGGWKLDGKAEKLSIDSMVSDSDWKTTNNGKNKIVTTVDGDFESTVKLWTPACQTTTADCYEEAGLVVYQDSDHYVLVGRKNRAATDILAGTAPWLSLVKETSSSAAEVNYIKDPNQDGPLYLKVKKVGNTFTAYYSLDGETWTQLVGNKGPSYDVTLSNYKVGLYAYGGKKKDGTPVAHPGPKFYDFTDFTLKTGDGEATPISFTSNNQAPGASNVALTAGTEDVTVDYMFSDPENDADENTLIAWYVADQQAGPYTRVNGAEGDALAATTETGNKWVKAVVAPADAAGHFGAPVVSDPVQMPAPANDETDATLSALSVDGLALFPAFDSDTTTYTVALPTGVDKVTVAAMPSQFGATVAGVGEVTLHEDPTEHTVTVTNGGAVQTYTITFHHYKGGDVYLKNLTAQAGENAISLDTTEYYMLDGTGHGEFSFTAEPSDPNATIQVRYNNVELGDYTQGMTLKLKPEQNELELRVVSEEGNAYKIYRVVVLNKISGDTKLSSLKIDGNDIALGENPDLGLITVGENPVFEAVANHEKASVSMEVDGKTAENGKPAPVGKPYTDAAVQVVAENGISTRVYTMQLIKQDPSDASLYSLDLAGLTLTQTDGTEGFDPYVTEYTASTGFLNDKTTLSATALQSDATITYETAVEYKTTLNGVITGQCSFFGDVGVPEGGGDAVNTVTVTVTSPNGQVTKTYTVHVTCKNEDWLSALDWTSESTTGWANHPTQKDYEINGAPTKMTLIDPDTNEVVTFDKGLGCHANCQTVYDISGKGYTKFSAKVGLDHSQASNSDEKVKGQKLIFEVLLDGEVVATAENLAVDTPYQVLECDIPTDAKKLTLRATYTNTVAAGAHADWADAKIYRSFAKLADTTLPTNVAVMKDGEEVTDQTELKVYTNDPHASHSLTLTATVRPDGVANKNVNWRRSEVTGKVTLTRGENNTLTVTAIHDPAETNVGPVTLNIYAEEDQRVYQTIIVKVVRELENNVTISIQGVNDPNAAPKFGQTLEADIHDLKMTDAGKEALSYQWKRTKNGVATNIGTNSKTYTINDADDVGAVISVDVTADPTTYYEGTRSATRSQAVVKAEGPSIPGSTIYGVKTTTEANNDGKIVGFGDEYAKYEYQVKDANDWKAVTAAEVTGLTNGEYQVRIKETATHEAGAAINVTVPAYNTNYKKVNIASDLENGTITRDHPQADPGTTITLTIKPATGYELDTLTVSKAEGTVDTTKGSNVTEDGKTYETYTFTLPNEDVTVSATFKKLKLTITHELTHLTCSKGTGSDSHEVEYGDTAAITLVPDEGYTLPARDTIEIKNAQGVAITGWTIDDNGTITITGGVTSNLTIKATGIVKTHVVNYSLTNGLSAPEANAARKVNHKAAYTGKLVAASGYKLPESIKITMGGEDFTDFTYENGTLTIAEGKIVGNLVITAEGVKDSGGNSSSGGGSSRPTTPSDTTKTETREDGSKVTTVTKPDGSKTVTVEQPDGTKSETVTTKDGDMTITVTDPEGEEIIKVELPATIPATESRFEDVPEGHWADEAIHNAAALKLVEGVGNNKYDMVSSMTRGSLATVLHRLSQGKTDYEVTFKDVAEGKYYTEGVAWAAKTGVVKGFSEEIFAPDQIITREQLAVMLARYAKLIGMDTKADSEVLDQFVDGENTGAWAVDGVAWCVANGILQGKGQNNLDPTAKVTRAEVAVMLDRFIALLK